MVSVSWHPNSVLLATGATDRRVRLFNAYVRGACAPGRCVTRRTAASQAFECTLGADMHTESREGHAECLRSAWPCAV